MTNSLQHIDPTIPVEYKPPSGLWYYNMNLFKPRRTICWNENLSVTADLKKPIKKRGFPDQSRNP